MRYPRCALFPTSAHVPVRLLMRRKAHARPVAAVSDGGGGGGDVILVVAPTEFAVVVVVVAVGKEVAFG